MPFGYRFYGSRLYDGFTRFGDDDTEAQAEPGRRYRTVLTERTKPWRSSGCHIAVDVPPEVLAKDEARIHAELERRQDPAYRRAVDKPELNALHAQAVRDKRHAYMYRFCKRGA